ncbi:TonB-dependent receptor [Mucilaginibacter sp. OK268]|uniref:SusC/RagA family TonB-linked outer membrane protein n=1 Tax=Mucilaginibacter sp. OK268 TaxID=1881048 RepID=UPI0015A34222|nr:TonB-dependent receptor [Mucilaginibacter sp. OK268]
MMKLTIVLLIAGLAQVSAKSYAQLITLHEKNVSIEKVLLLIEKQSGYHFIYDDNLDVLRSRTLNISVEKQTIGNVLDQCLNGIPVSYKIFKKTIALKETEQSQIEKSVITVQRISGTVTDDKGAPLPGASVMLKDVQKGTVTNAAGQFSIDAKPGDVLVISFVGFQTREIVIGAQSKIEVSMTALTSALNEMVVVGYTTQSRHKLTSAVVTVSGDELNKRVATSPSTLLQGKLPGLQVVQGSGEPGAENVQLTIRGTGTFSGAGSNPLVIVDGLPGSLDVLNANDIESISVLKDASSAAIYGSRGANGVIVVKTKRGKAGSLTVQYTYNFGISNATKLPDLVTNSATYMQLSNEARTNSSLAPLYTQAQIDLYQNATDKVKYPNHNWLDDIFRTAYTQNHYLNMSGGKDSTTYSVGIGITNQPGVMRGFDYSKYTLSLGLNSKLNKRITFGSDIQMRYGKKLTPENGASDQFLSALAQSPLYPAQVDGKWIKKAYSNELGNKNPVAIVDEDIRTRGDDKYIQGNLSLDIDLFRGLRWENKAGFNYGIYKFNDFRPIIPTYYYSDMSPAGNLDDGSPGLNVGNSDNLYTVYYSQLTYKKSFGGHNFSAFAGLQQERNTGSNINASRTQYVTNFLRELDAGPSDGQTNGGTSSSWAISSLYGSANYDYEDKYLLGASIRYDGTSRLPSDTRYGTFYSFSGGWRISKENFLKDVSWLNDLKIRGSWGQLGNQNIGTYPYQSTLSGANYAFGGTVTSGFVSNTLVDPNLTWETTRVADVGLDMTAFNNKLVFSADYFNKYTFDILRGSQVPYYVGLNAPTINNGALRNKGFEFAVQYNDRIGKDFTYTVGLNLQTYKNKLEQYGSKDISDHTIREEGHELDAYYMYVWDGIFQSQAEIDNSPKQPVTPTPGDLKIKDINGDGKIDANDRTYVGGKFPSYQYSANLGAGYKGFDFSAQIYGSQGQKTYVNGWGIEPFRQGSIPTTDWLNRWTPTNHTNTMPKIYVADGYAPVQNYPSTYFLKDASFIRLKSLQLGYSFPISMLNRISVKSLRIFVAADNVFTISKYPGLDPERVGDGNYVTYPQNRTITFGASIKL